jgi:hypothetical protein
MGKSFKSMADTARKGGSGGKWSKEGRPASGDGTREVKPLADKARGGSNGKDMAEMVREGDQSKPVMGNGQSAPSVDIAKTPGSDAAGGAEMKAEKPKSQQPDALGRKSKL